MKLKLAGAIVSASLGVLGCSGPATSARTGSTDMSEQSARSSQSDPLARLHAAHQALSEATAKSGSAKGLAAFLADDAVMLLEGQYVLKGREAILAHLAAHPLEQGTMRLEAVRWDVSRDGHLGYSVGSATHEAPGADGAPAKHFSRFMAAWRQQPDGTWRIAAFVHNPAKAPLAPPQGFAPTPAPTASGERQAAPAAVLAEAFAADSAFSALSTKEGMGRAFAAYAAEDSLLLGGPGGIFGREGITQAYAPLTLDKVQLSWQPVLGDAAPSGDLAFTIGRATVVGRDKDGKPETDHVKYLTVWRRQADGAWRYVADGGNGSPGPNGP